LWWLPQAPAANHRASQKAMNDTFSMSNISPQVSAAQQYEQ
jgi:DNA/RNA endonuclease G (NUC1)